MREYWTNLLISTDKEIYIYKTLIFYVVGSPCLRGEWTEVYTRKHLLLFTNPLFRPVYSRGSSEVFLRLHSSLNNKCTIS